MFSMMHVSARVFTAVSLAVLLLAGLSFAGEKKIKGPIVGYPLQFGVSQPVRDMPPQAISHRQGGLEEKPLHRIPRQSTGSVVDPVVQNSATTPAAATSLSQWEGLGAGYPGFTVTAVPPDTNMAVGPNHIVQWVNGGLVIFDKQGHQLQAPVDDETFWGGLSSTCDQLGGFSDPVVQYDRMANRWIVGEIALPLWPGLIGQFAQCFAVSTGPDPTGSYYQWAYGFGADIPDYPKVSVWPDGYYVTWNIFPNGGATFAGPETCAFNRQDMLNGASAPAYICFTLPNTYSSLLASDLDGGNLPPAGSPNFLMDVDATSGALHLWKMHVSFANPNSSTFTGGALSGVAAFNSPCLATQDCIAQPGTAQKLDAIGDRLMYRLPYRNFGDHESLVANHSVIGSNGAIGVRWYEVRSPNASPVIYQQGTFAPDNDNRWMASIAQDQAGNVAVGYSVASGATYPSIRYTGWEVGNPFGTLQTETALVAGGGSQTGYNRWGDYSAMQIDPSDDCTFWYTQEYQATTASANWNTRIGSFKFDSCGGPAKTATSTGLTSSPNPSDPGQTVTLTATVTPVGATGNVTFYDGAGSLGTGTLDANGVATLSTSSLTSGTHQLTATYNGDANYNSSTSSILSHVVNSAPLGTTSTSVTSSGSSSVYGQTVTFTAHVTVVTGTGTPTGTVTFKDGTTTLGSSAIDGSGNASLSTSSLSVTSHSITAVYSGDANFTGSTSSAITQTVNKANTSALLTSNRNPAKSQQTITFTATVSPSNATGTVQFKDGSSNLGSPITLTNGTAALSTKLSKGSHTITAVYSGDGNYNGTTSNGVLQTVR